MSPRSPHRQLGESRTVNFHNFKSQNCKLSVSNPKSKYVAYVSVLSQISNCQGLGRKNNFEILKTDRKVQNMHTHIHTYIHTYVRTYIRTLHYITLHYITLRYIKLPYITLHYIT